jgi:environmental stress-induced protein Ves
VRVITADAWRTQRWHNGGGVTHEIVRWPDRGDDHDDYDVRVSLAEVATSGPFSQFAGYHRWSFLAGPAPIELVQAVAPTRAVKLVALGDHVAVPGDLALSANLRAGPTYLVNVLARTDVVVGYGPVAHPVRLAFALVDRPVLARWSTAVFEPAERFETTTCVRIAWS